MPLPAPLCTSLLNAPAPTLRPADCTTARRSAHPACRPMTPTLSPGACCLALSAPRQLECRYSAGQPRLLARGHSRLRMHMRVIHMYYIRTRGTLTAGQFTPFACRGRQLSAYVQHILRWWISAFGEGKERMGNAIERIRVKSRKRPKKTAMLVSVSVSFTFEHCD